MGQATFAELYYDGKKRATRLERFWNGSIAWFRGNNLRSASRPITRRRGGGASPTPSQ